MRGSGWGQRRIQLDADFRSKPNTCARKRSVIVVWGSAPMLAVTLSRRSTCFACFVSFRALLQYVSEVNASHAVAVSQPDVVVNIILDAARASVP